MTEIHVRRAGREDADTLLEMEWFVLDWNELAQGVYRKLVGAQLDEWRLCRLTGEALRRLSEA